MLLSMHNFIRVKALFTLSSIYLKGFVTDSPTRELAAIWMIAWGLKSFIVEDNNSFSSLIQHLTKVADSAMDDWVRGLSERPKGAVCYKWTEYGQNLQKKV